MSAARAAMSASAATSARTGLCARGARRVLGAVRPRCLARCLPRRGAMSTRLRSGSLPLRDRRGSLRGGGAADRRRSARRLGPPSVHVREEASVRRRDSARRRLGESRRRDATDEGSNPDARDDRAGARGHFDVARRRRPRAAARSPALAVRRAALLPARHARPRERLGSIRRRKTAGRPRPRSPFSSSARRAFWRRRGRVPPCSGARAW